MRGVVVGFEWALEEAEQDQDHPAHRRRPLCRQSDCWIRDPLVVEEADCEMVLHGDAHLEHPVLVVVPQFQPHICQ